MIKNEKGILVQIQPCQVHGRLYDINYIKLRTGHHGRLATDDLICTVSKADTFIRK